MTKEPLVRLPDATEPLRTNRQASQLAHNQPPPNPPPVSRSSHVRLAFVLQTPLAGLKHQSGVVITLCQSPEEHKQV